MKTKFFNALSLAVIMAMLVTSLALADNVENDVVSVPASITLQAGVASSYVDVQFWIQPNSNDGDPQCNFDTSSEQLTFTINAPSGVTTNPSSLTFNKCKDGGNLNAQTVRFSASSSAVSGNISFTTNSNNSGGSFNYSNAVFYINMTTPPPSDTTAPTTAPTQSPAANGAGWNNADVTVAWNWTDNAGGLGIDPANCTTSSTSSGEGVIELIATCKDIAGNTGNASYTVKVDKTAPTIIFVGPSPAAWYNSDVTANWSCSDTTSGAVSALVSATTSGEGPSQSATGTCADNAGNVASNTQSFMVDLTDPTISGSAAPLPNGYGWNNSNVTVSFTCDDSPSGIASCGPDVTLSGEGAGQSVTGTAVDNAGNSASTTVSGINIDKTAPTASASASPAPNGYGWNNSDVTVTFNGSDSLSGNDSCTAPVTLSGEGAGQSASGTCTDKAGNISAPATAIVSIDKTAPTVALVGGPVSGGTYYFGFVPGAPSCDTSDALSGIDGSCSVTGYGSAIGNHTVTASAADMAGNSASASASYTVLAWDLRGFYQPVDMNGVYNVVKNGSTVPLKFEIFAGSTELTDIAYVKSLTYALTACSTTATTDEIETTATGGTVLRYDATSGQFIFNWKTPNTAGKCYRVTMTTQDGSTLVAYFKLK